MQLRRLDVEDPLDAIGRRTASLLNDESEWVRLVQKTEFAVIVSAVGRVGEQSTTEEIAVEIRYQRADVTRIHRLAISLLAAVVAHQILDLRLPLAVVRVVHRQISADIRCPDVRVRQQE